MDYYTYNDTDMYYGDETDSSNNEYGEHPHKSILTTQIILGIITNLALLIVLLYRLVRDILNRDMDKARWAKRHTLIAKCALFVFGFTLNIATTQSHHESTTVCKITQAVYYSSTMMDKLWNIVLAYLTLLHLCSPASLFGSKQLKFWLGIHLIIIIVSFCFNIVLTSYTFESVTSSSGRCFFQIGNRYMMILQNSLNSILPLIAFLFLAMVTTFCLCCASPPLPNSVDSKMCQWLTRTRLSAVLFLFVFAILSCFELLYYMLYMLFWFDYIREFFQDNMYTLSTLLMLHPVLFPVCCLIFEESWLCYAIDKKICSRQTSKQAELQQSGTSVEESESLPVSQ